MMSGALKKLLTLRPRERRLALIAGVLIGCWGLISGVVHPLWEQGRQLRVHVQSQSEKLRSISRLLASSATIERTYQQAAPYLELRDDEQVQRACLAELETLSRQSGMKLNLKPHPLRREERTSRFDVEVDVEGSQPDLLAFLDSLLQLPRLMTIDRVRVAAVPARESVLRANLAIQYFTVQK